MYLVVLALVRPAELVGPGPVGRVREPLQQKEEEDGVVAEGHEPVLERHVDQEREDIVDERLEDLVHEGLERKVRHGLEAVVDVQLREHLHEPEQVPAR